MQWLPKGANPPLKAKVSQSAKKVMATIFWDASGILLVDYLEQGVTINSRYYSALLTDQIRETLSKKRPGKI